MSRARRIGLSRRRFVGGALGVAALAAALRDAAAGEATLRRARGGNLTSLDPHRPISAADMEIAADLFVGLTACDAQGAIVPGCAEGWEVSADGRRYAQVDLPYPTGGWEAGTHQQTELAVPLPADLPGGAYRLVIGMYDPNGGARLALKAPEPIDPALDGPDALPLAEVELK